MFREEDCEKAAEGVNDRWFGMQPIVGELSPVTNFREV